MVRIRNIVDDINIQSSGNETLVVRSIAGAAKQLIAGLIELELPLSTTKTAFMASSNTAARRITEALLPHKISRKHAVRNLGTDTGGNKRTTATQSKRFLEAFKRSYRVQRLRQTGAFVARI